MRTFVPTPQPHPVDGRCILPLPFCRPRAYSYILTIPEKTTCRFENDCRTWSSLWPQSPDPMDDRRITRQKAAYWAEPLPGKDDCRNTAGSCEANRCRPDQKECRSDARNDGMERPDICDSNTCMVEVTGYNGSRVLSWVRQFSVKTQIILSVCFRLLLQLRFSMSSR